MKNHPNVTVLNKEIHSIPEGHTIIATGPLTTEHLAKEIVEITGKDQLYFYDAAAQSLKKIQLIWIKSI